MRPAVPKYPAHQLVLLHFFLAACGRRVGLYLLDMMSCAFSEAVYWFKDLLLINKMEGGR